jgi:hypothetical protein
MSRVGHNSASQEFRYPQSSGSESTAVWWREPALGNGSTGVTTPEDMAQHELHKYCEITQLSISVQCWDSIAEFSIQLAGGRSDNNRCGEQGTDHGYGLAEDMWPWNKDFA